jgi:hypothetical protein
MILEEACMLSRMQQCHFADVYDTISKRTSYEFETSIESWLVCIHTTSRAHEEVARDCEASG